MKSPASLYAIAALRHKETRENRPALIVGAAIFVAVPLLWTSLAISFDVRHGAIPGILSIMLLVFGWIYGAIVGAQIVCRDFGRPTGRFLLAHPVLPSDAMRAKLTVGFRQLSGLVLIVGFIEFCLMRFLDQPRWTVGLESTLPLLVLGAIATLVAFCLSFTAAAITRNTLVAAIFTALVLVLLVTVPYVSSSATYYVPSIFWVLLALAQLFSDLTGISVGLATAVLFIAFFGFVLWAITRLALWAAARTTRLWLGTRSIAWTVAALVVGVFCTAMNEVGTTIPVSSTRWNFAENGAYSIVQSIAAAPGHVALTLHGANWVEITAIDQAGGIHSSQDVDLPKSHHTRLPDAHLLLSFQSNDLFVLNTNRRMVNDDVAPEFWIELYQMDVAASTVRSLGDVPLEGELSGAVDAWVTDFVASGGRLNLYLAVSFDAGIQISAYGAPTASSHCKYFIASYAVPSPPSDPSAALKFLGAVEFPAAQDGLGYGFVTGADGNQYLRTNSGFYDVTDQSSISLGTRNWGNVIPVTRNTVAGTDVAGLICQRLFPPQLDSDGSLIRAARTETISTLRLSPLAGLIDNGYLLFSPARHQVWVHGRNSLTGFDVSDASHPRRIGHVTTFPFVHAVACSDFIVLDHGAGISIIKLPK